MDSTQAESDDQMNTSGALSMQRQEEEQDESMVSGQQSEKYDDTNQDNDLDILDSHQSYQQNSYDEDESSDSEESIKRPGKKVKKERSLSDIAALDPELYGLRRSGRARKVRGVWLVFDYA